MNTNRLVAISVFVVLLLGLITPCSFATNLSQGITPNQKQKQKQRSSAPFQEVKPTNVKAIQGYCCTDNGMISSLTKTQCKSKKGQYYTNQQEAEQSCGTCCLKDGTLQVMQPGNCKAHRGTYYDYASGNAAKRACRTGYCCKDGTITETISTTCNTKGDKFYITEAEALIQCKGYCCSDFEVSKTTEQQCDTSKGEFFGKESQAERYCLKQKGYCCKNGKITRETQKQCSQKGEQFFTTNTIAAKACKTKKGFCNDNTRTLRLTEAECNRKKGTYFSSHVLANKELLKYKRKLAAQNTPLPKNKSGGMEQVQIAPPSTRRLPPKTTMMAQRPIYNPFGFIHPSNNEAFTKSAPQFSWRPHPAANKYYLRIMKTGAGAGSHRTIWSKAGIAENNITFNSDGTATESLVTGTEYRANLYARLSSHTGWPDTNPAGFIQMTGDVVFTVKPGKGRVALQELSANSIRKTTNEDVKKLSQTISPLADNMVYFSSGHGYYLIDVESESEIKIPGISKIRIIYSWLSNNAFYDPPDQTRRTYLFNRDTGEKIKINNLSRFDSSWLTYEDERGQSEDILLPEDMQTGSWQVRISDRNFSTIYGESQPFTVGAALLNPEILSFLDLRFTSSECNGNNIEVSVQTDDGPYINLLYNTDTIPISWKPFALCSPGSWADPGNNIRMFLHKVDENVNLWEAIHTVSYEERQVGIRYNYIYEFSTLDIDKDVPYVVSIYAGESYYGHSKPFLFRKQPFDCNGSNIIVTTQTESRSGMDIIKADNGAISIRWRATEVCPIEPGWAHLFGNDDMAVFLHKVGDSPGIGFPLGGISYDDRQLDLWHSRDFLYHPERIESDAWYQVSIYGGESYYGRTSQFRFSVPMVPEPFNIYTPRSGLWINRSNPPDISWTIPPGLDSGTDRVEANFRVELVKDGSVEALLFRGMVPYDMNHKLCSIPWQIEPEIQDGGDYSIKVTALPVNQYDHAGNYTSTMPGSFHIYSEGATDVNPEDANQRVSNAAQGISVDLSSGDTTVYLAQRVHIRWSANRSYKDHNDNERVTISIVDGTGNIVQGFGTGEAYGGTKLWKVGYEEDRTGQFLPLGSQSGVPPVFEGSGYRIKVQVTPDNYVHSMPIRVTPPYINTIRANNRPNRENVDVTWEAENIAPETKFAIWGIRRVYCLNGSINSTCYNYRAPYTFATETRPFLMVGSIPANIRSYTANHSDCESPTLAIRSWDYPSSACRENAELRKIAVTVDGFYDDFILDWVRVD